MHLERPVETWSSAFVFSSWLMPPSSWSSSTIFSASRKEDPASSRVKKGQGNFHLKIPTHPYANVKHVGERIFGCNQHGTSMYEVYAQETHENLKLFFFAWGGKRQQLSGQGQVLLGLYSTACVNKDQWLRQRHKTGIVSLKKHIYNESFEGFFF